MKEKYETPSKGVLSGLRWKRRVCGVAATSHDAGTEHAGAGNAVIQSGCACPRDISINIPAENRPRLVIIGGGFAGLYLARNLRKVDLQIVLFDRNDYRL